MLLFGKIKIEDEKKQRMNKKMCAKVLCRCVLFIHLASIHVYRRIYRRSNVSWKIQFFDEMQTCVYVLWLLAYTYMRRMLCCNDDDENEYSNIAFTHWDKKERKSNGSCCVFLCHAHNRNTSARYVSVRMYFAQSSQRVWVAVYFVEAILLH